MRNRLLVALAGCLSAFAAPSFAADCNDACETTNQAGRTFEAFTAITVYGPNGVDAPTVRQWVPVMVADTAGNQFNQVAMNIVNGRVMGATTIFDPIDIVLTFGTADELDSDGGFTSNNAVVFEAANNSNTVGALLSNGTVVSRAAFAGAQNNIEFVETSPNQQTAIPEPTAGTPILTGAGIDGAAGSAFLSTPSAALTGASFIMGQSNFSTDGSMPVAINVWTGLNAGTVPVAANAPNHSYLQGDVRLAAGFGDPGDERLTAPIFAIVGGDTYVAFGYNDTTDGGSARPAVLFVDVLDANDSLGDAAQIAAPAGFRFIDHQATGGGANPFEGPHFSMNSSGQICALVESTATVPSYAILVYDPIFGAGRITGYSAPTTIADAGLIDNIDDDMTGPILLTDANDVVINIISAFSGVSINDKGDVSFSAVFDSGVLIDPNDPNVGTFDDTGMFYFDSSEDALFRVATEFALIDTIPGGGVDPNLTGVRIGLIRQEDSASFFANSMAPNANVLGVPFENAGSGDGLGDHDGILVVAVGHIGDLNFDNTVDLSDLAGLLAGFGASLGDANYDPQADLDLDGTIGLGDLAGLLANFGANF